MEGIDELVSELKKKLQQRFCTIVDLATYAINTCPYDERYLQGHCGEVSRITQSVVGGEIIEIIYNGKNPFISYLGREIASGHLQAFHAYVLVGGEVWDPTVGVYGTLGEEEYLNNIGYENHPTSAP